MPWLLHAGLLDQLALGQLCGSDEGTDPLYDEGAESESWTMADAMSADMEPWFGGAAAAAAGTNAGAASSSGGSSSGGSAQGDKAFLHAHLHQHLCQQHLQPVQEVAEDCC